MTPFDISIILLVLAIGVFFIAVWAIFAVNYAMRRRDEYDALEARVTDLENRINLDNVIRSYRGSEQGDVAG